MNTRLLEDKVIVVVGGTTGLGLSSARAFVREGAKVVIVGRNARSVDEAQAALGSSAQGLSGDATDPNTAPFAIQTAMDHFGAFHGLYHVAGGSGRRMGDGALHEISDAGWDYTLNQNLTSLFYSNRAAAQQFLKQGTGGSVLNIGSVLGQSPSPRYFSAHAYAATKAAIVGLTRASAGFYAAENIRFNVLAPALVRTPMVESAVEDEDVQEFIRSKQPLDGGRVGLPEDLDAAAVYFLSDQSRFVTGQVLTVDGGWSVSDGQYPDA